ncbi:MAG TPA: pilus assembly protein PilM [Sedimentisphaerales bacterium]|nr:pilus assembly protein PilM [Sedimentisphaerales bacterium]HRV46321.1 pilus assembly protein PilM [Sedimentisphaerales bacterium]
MRLSHWINRKEKILPIGLDIGHSVVKMIQLAVSDDGVRVLAAGRAVVGLNDMSDDNAWRQRVAPAIRRLLAEGAFKGRDVVTALPADKLRITSVRLPEMPNEEVEQTLRKEAAHRFALNPKIDAISYVLAGNVRQGDELKNEYILFASDDEAIRGHIALLEEVGLQPTGIDASPCALFRCFERVMRRQEDKERTIMFLDVGHRYTTIVLGRAGEICFVKQMAFGAARFAEDIAAKLSISVTDAEALRRQMMSDDSVDAATRRLVVDTLHGTAEQLAGEISLCLRYYTVTFRGKRVERALMAGGGVHEEALLSVMRHHLAIETDIAEPLRGFDLTSVGVAMEDLYPAADFSLAVGLCLKGWGASTVSLVKSDVGLESILEGAS